MSKCSKVKNPCKICLGPVTQKNGLKCQGVCQNWIHYGCLNYTPGRISDIKKGIIKVTCPCPDCKTTSPKEFRTDAPFSCDNSMCPANRPPQCQNNECPINMRFPEKMNQTSYSRPCPLNRCGKDCKQHSSPMLHENPKPQYQQPCAPKPPCPLLPQCPICPTPPCPSDHKQAANYNQIVPVASISDTILDMHACPSVYTNTSSDIPGDIGIAYASIDSNMNSALVFEEMCTAVGQLTNQINELMGKMRQVILDKHGGCIPQPPRTNCSQKGPRSLCPKPCYCPGNPSRRK
ncbi:hypothetical protein K1T71_013494 [Dendrolimus kikuchii]|uniref:Uncharacterized protein n=1 Tax=Dendrolimus kikuchii TaxID=765133 RepID=A0ACC1CGZ6_9NEOP|nr:hypothetical protein K1T71_013494 [Dendrolimus kikuchii]